MDYSVGCSMVTLSWRVDHELYLVSKDVQADLKFYPRLPHHYRTRPRVPQTKSAFDDYEHFCLGIAKQPLSYIRHLVVFAMPLHLCGEVFLCVETLIQRPWGMFDAVLWPCGLLGSLKRSSWLIWVIANLSYQCFVSRRPQVTIIVSYTVFVTAHVPSLSHI